MDRRDQIYISAEAIIGSLACVGNGFVLVAIIKNRRLQTVTNCFIASLALADFLVGIVVAPLAALSYLGLPDDFLGCTFINSIVLAFTQVSIFNLLAVAFERFFAIKHPFAYKKHLDIKISLIVNGGVWFVGMMFGLIPVFGWNLKQLQDESWKCNFVTVIDMEYVVYFHFFGCIVVPLLIITGIYCYIFLIVRKQLSQIAVLEVTNPEERPKRSTTRFKQEIKAAKSLAIVIFLFAVSWIPIHVLNTMTLTCGTSCPYPLELLLATIVLSHANSAVNPLLYAYGNSNFKKAFKKMLCNIQESDLLTTEGNASHINNHSTGPHNSESFPSKPLANGSSNSGEAVQTKCVRIQEIQTVPDETSDSNEAPVFCDSNSDIRTENHPMTRNPNNVKDIVYNEREQIHNVYSIPLH